MILMDDERREPVEREEERFNVRAALEKALSAADDRFRETIDDPAEYEGEYPSDDLESIVSSLDGLRSQEHVDALEQETLRALAVLGGLSFKKPDQWEPGTETRVSLVGPDDLTDTQREALQKEWAECVVKILGREVPTATALFYPLFSSNPRDAKYGFLPENESWTSRDAEDGQASTEYQDGVMTMLRDNPPELLRQLEDALGKAGALLVDGVLWHGDAITLEKMRQFAELTAFRNTLKNNVEKMVG